MSKERYYLFSNGTEFMQWQERNCDQCVKATFISPDTWRVPNYRCAIQKHIELAAISDGMGNKRDYEADRAEGPQMGDRADNGRPYAYGKRTKAKQRRTVDGEANRQQRIQFGTEHTDNDNVTADDLEERTGFKPFGSEW